jgi:hypothetical protein
MEKYVWEGSASQSNLAQILSKIVTSPAPKPPHLEPLKEKIVNEENIVVVEPVKHYRESAMAIHNKGLYLSLKLANLDLDVNRTFITWQWKHSCRRICWIHGGVRGISEEAFQLEQGVALLWKSSSIAGIASLQLRSAAPTSFLR